MSIWTLAMFFVSGLDIVIVGHYQYKDTGFYSVASGAANFMLAVVSSLFGPLVPAVSSMQAGTTPSRIGDICIRLTRYCGSAYFASRDAAAIWQLSFAQLVGW